MGYQIIQGRDSGTFAVYCSNTDTFVGRKQSRGDVVFFFADLAVERATSDVVRIFEKLAKGEAPYFQFTLTLDEAEKIVAKATGAGGEG